MRSCEGEQRSVSFPGIDENAAGRPNDVARTTAQWFNWADH